MMLCSFLGYCTECIQSLENIMDERFNRDSTEIHFTKTGEKCVYFGVITMLQYVSQLHSSFIIL